MSEETKRAEQELANEFDSIIDEASGTCTEAEMSKREQKANEVVGGVHSRMPKPTPGPWEVAPTGYRVMSCSRGGKYGRYICDTANNKATRTPENAANAVLIARAPELNELLKGQHEISQRLGHRISSAMEYVRLSLARLKAAHPEWTESMDLDDWDTGKWKTQDFQDWTEHEFAIALLSRLEGK